jgi:hypothetical protein
VEQGAFLSLVGLQAAEGFVEIADGWSDEKILIQHDAFSALAHRAFGYPRSIPSRYS